MYIVPDRHKYDFVGKKIIAIYEEQTNVSFKSTILQDFLNPSLDMEEGNAIIQDILQGIHFLHAQGRASGPKALDFNHILIIPSSIGPQALLCIPKDSNGDLENDIRAAGILLRKIWTFTNCLRFVEMDLVTRMISEKLPSAKAVLQDLAFWSQEKKLALIVNVSNILELKQKKHWDAVEKDVHDVFKDSWMDVLDPMLREKIEKDKRRKYNKTRIQDLLRVVRNLTGHFDILAPELRKILGPAENLVNYWEDRFPLLIPAVYKAMEPSVWTTTAEALSSSIKVKW